MYQIVQAIVISVEMDSDGYPSATVMDKNGGILTDCEFLHRGGGEKNIRYCPSEGSTNGEPEYDSETRKGARVFVLRGVNIPAVILGALDQPTLKKSRFAESADVRDKPLAVGKAESYPSRVSYADQLDHQDGSQVVIGKTAGVTLDTTGNESPVRVQVGSDAYLRISQENAETNDHVVLASALFSLLTDLETKVNEIITVVNAHSVILGGLTSPGTLPNGSPGPVASSIPVVPGNAAAVGNWTKGNIEEIQASAIRISEKSVSEE